MNIITKKKLHAYNKNPSTMNINLKSSVIEFVKNKSVTTPIGLTWIYTVWSSVPEVLSLSLIERNKRV